MTESIALPEVVSAEEWEARRVELLKQEKEVTRARDALAAARRRMPMVEFPDTYRFTSDGPDASLLDLFEGRRQLIVYQFMHIPDGWCEGCNMFVDTIGRLEHLHARDTSLAVVSNTPWERLGPHRKRMEWRAPFYSSAGTTFSADTGTGEGFGINVFLRDGDRIFRTYFVTNRAADGLGNHWLFLDLTPLGRQESWEDTPEGRPQTPPYQWWRLHDEYVATG
jgi:predicted dithiol-disulfide oxidoreductase (DUF899 family)